MRKVIKKVIASPTAPQESNVLWLQGVKLYKKFGTEWILLNGGTSTPDGYAKFMTADDMIFSASDGDFYVKL